MTSRMGKRLVDDFLIPALNTEKYGDMLKWNNPEKKIFAIQWNHKNSANWNDSNTKVFQDWDKLKGRYKPEKPNYHMQAKQRFRAALYKISGVAKLPSNVKNYKYYQIVDKKKITQGAGNKKKPMTNRVSVIKKNTSYIVNPQHPTSDEESENKSEYFDCMQDYKVGLKNKSQMTQANSPVKENLLKENNSDNQLQLDLRNHVKSEPSTPVVPVYFNALTDAARYSIMESPHMMLVSTYAPLPQREESPINLSSRSEDSLSR